MRHPAFACALLASVALTPACELPEPFDFGPSCSSGVAAQVGGTWTLHGEGERHSCADPSLDAAQLFIDSLPLEIAQAGASLSLAEPIAIEGVTFTLDDATVSGACVRFTTTERGPDGRIVTLTFTGERRGSLLDGTFTGVGPGTCRLEGDFTVDVRP